MAIDKLTEFEINFLLKNGKRSSILCNFDFQSITLFSYGFLKKKIPIYLKKEDFEKLVKKAFKDRKQKLKEVPGEKEIIYFVLWLNDEIKFWNEKEADYLSSDPDMKMLAAGIKELDIFGINNTIDALAGGDITKYKKVESLPYGMIFDKLWKTTIEQKIQKKLSKQK